MNILIVDDDFASRRLLTRFLTRLGECDVAISGVEAIQAIKASWEEGRPYELLCLDIDMPVMDGHETLRAIRQLEEERRLSIGRGVKIIMTTAHTASAHLLGSFREGCEAYLVKPFTREQLFAQLQFLGIGVTF